jgi:hypothetical protein
MTIRRGVFALVAVFLVACRGPVLPSGVVPDDQMSFTAGNYTDRVLELVVNGAPVAELAAASQQELTAGKLPALPWRVEIRLPTGRRLLELTIGSGSVTRTATGSVSPGARADLSCGRIEIWSGYPLIGPVPGAGVPGDCAP